MEKIMAQNEIKIDNNLEEFKKLVRKAIFLEGYEDEYFKAMSTHPNKSLVKSTKLQLLLSFFSYI